MAAPKNTFQLESPSSILLYSTVLLECEAEDGSTSCGTAFRYDIPCPGGQTLPVLVTNKHVVEDAKAARFNFHQARPLGPEETAPSGSFVSVEHDDNFQAAWVPHPDENVDLCAMDLRPILFNAVKGGSEIFSSALTVATIPSDETLAALSASEEVRMIGYPTGLFDTVHNFPLIRRGHTASHPAVDYGGEAKAVMLRNTIKRILLESGVEPAPERGKHMPWKTFLKAHWGHIAAADFFTIEVLSLVGLVRYHVFFVLDLKSRRVEIAGIVCDPASNWMPCCAGTQMTQMLYAYHAEAKALADGLDAKA